MCRTLNIYGSLPEDTPFQYRSIRWGIYWHILFEEIQPTVQAPSATISFKSPFTANKILEVGESAPTAEQIQTGFNRGNCTVVGQANKNRAGELISDDQSFIYVGNSTSNKTLPVKVTLGTMQYPLVAK